MSGAENTAPNLSIVVCGRNDNYGQTFGLRFQTFLKHLASLNEAQKALFELIIVEWNPPLDRESLAEAFDWSGVDSARIVTVPPEAHASIDNPGNMPLLEFWAKNVGVRRARAPFVLSTNPDILLSPAFFDFVVEGKLDPRLFLRADRYDTAPNLVFAAEGRGVFQQALDSIFEVHTRNPVDPEEPMSQFVDPATSMESWPQSRPFYKDRLCEDQALILSGERLNSLSGLHTQASGDFILASRNAWDCVRGHWERTDTFTHLDSYLVCQMQAAGFTQAILQRPMMAVHLDHMREEQAGRPRRPYSEVMAELRAIASGEFTNPNGANWGLADVRLPETKPNAARAPRVAIAKREPVPYAVHVKALAAEQARASAQRLEATRRAQQAEQLAEHWRDELNRTLSESAQCKTTDRTEMDSRLASLSSEVHDLHLEARAAARIWARERAAIVAGREAAEAKLSRLSDEAHALKIQAYADRRLRASLQADLSALTTTGSVMQQKLLAAESVLRAMEAEREERERRLQAATSMHNEALRRAKQAEDRAKAFEAELNGIKLDTAKDARPGQDPPVEQSVDPVIRHRQKDMLAKLEDEKLQREQRVQALEAALADALQRQGEAEGDRDRLSAQYKSIVENSRYLRARRTILRLLRRN